MDGLLWRLGKKLSMFEFLFSWPKQNNSTDWKSIRVKNLRREWESCSTMLAEIQIGLKLDLPEFDNNLDP